MQGYHLIFFHDWVDLWNGNWPALKEKYGSLERAAAVYGGLGRETLLRQYRDDLERAKRLGAGYVVFHVSDVSMEECFTYRFSHTNDQVITAALELINELLPGKQWPFAFLVENQWWPGFSGSVLDYFAFAVFLNHSSFVHHRQHHGNASQPAGRHPLNRAQQGFQMLFKLAVIHKYTIRTVSLQNGQHIRHKLLARQIFLVFLFVGSAAGIHLFQLLKIRVIENAGVTGEVTAGPQPLDALRIQHTPALQRLIDRILLVHKLLVGEN
ncbi:MAG: hypothetical protein MRZ73_07210, partial [Pseudoflavonifractor capillosus]|nr:hypothetical protein [Pseudoflavonifractor capillosus]